jgi:K+-sensing histidine kinase KdpD
MSRNARIFRFAVSGSKTQPKNSLLIELVVRLDTEVKALKANAKKVIRQRSAWLASMFGCAAFLLLAVKLYNVSLSSLASNLVIVLFMLAVIVGAAAALGWVIARVRMRRK